VQSRCYVNYGLPPFRLIRTATLEEADFFKMLDELARGRHRCFLAEMDLKFPRLVSSRARKRNSLRTVRSVIYEGQGTSFRPNSLGSERDVNIAVRLWFDPVCAVVCADGEIPGD